MDKLARVYFNQVKFGVYIYIYYIYIAVNVVHNYFTQYMSTTTWTTELDLRNNNNKDDDYDDDDDDDDDDPFVNFSANGKLYVSKESVKHFKSCSHFLCLSS